ncbi:MAG: dihydroorotase [Flavobacteriaceae bacterium]|nr:dihydroorotase [Flavobacteriaceae bacterium]
MARRKLLKNAQVVSAEKIVGSDVLIEDDIILKIEPSITDVHAEVVDLSGKYLLPGLIDDQVHFREPGLTHKGSIATESKAALAGGITSFMEQPNTNPQTITYEALEDKFERAKTTSWVNYSFFFGGTNDNLELIKRLPLDACAGVKLFLGSSTGNMLVDKLEVIEAIFSSTPHVIAAHCEDEQTIRENTERAIAQYGSNIPFSEHPLIRSEEACYLSSSQAVSLAQKTGARLHVFHLSTAKEIDLFRSDLPLSKKKITAEACIHHLWFTDADYQSKQSLIKWNPAVKTANDKEALWKALEEGAIDVIATDHAPHTLEEKKNPYLSAPSGGPLVQHALQALIDQVKERNLGLPFIVKKMCNNPAELFSLKDRGYIKEGYKADLVVVEMNKAHRVAQDNLWYHCGWSPFEGHEFSSSIDQVWVNGTLAFKNGSFVTRPAVERLRFNRN